ncbi:MAG: hypothetical protein OEV99_14210 [Nitrospira sp.]|nr:hypothetical protein [Nitrospira sp.]MDH4370976.1 hypothetical protein [Nitrospira sp.]
MGSTIIQNDDGSETVENDDGSRTTTWPDSASHVDYADGSSMTTYSDGRVMNVYPDGTKTLNDVNGNPLDPTTGKPLLEPPDQSIPTPPSTTVEQLTEILDGASAIADLDAANGILRGLAVTAVVDKQYSALSELAKAFGEALKGELSPANWFIQWLKMVLQVVKSMETEERGVAMRSWCYTVTYDAMGMGIPPDPTFSSLRGADQEALNKEWWDAARNQGEEQLADGKRGVSLRNRVLLLVAKCGADPAIAVNELWATACRNSGDDGNAGLLAAYPSLSWPEPTGA